MLIKLLKELAAQVWGHSRDGPGPADTPLQADNNDGAFSQSDDAEQHYRRSIASEPGNAAGHHALGLLLLETSRPEAALTSLTTACELAPDSARCWCDVAVAYGQVGKLEQAVRGYETAVGLDPEFALAWSNLGEVLRALGQLEPAHNAATKAVAIDPNSAAILNNLASVLAELGESEAALRAAEQALAIDPQHAPAHSNRGAVLAAIGQPGVAHEALSQALVLDPNAAASRFTLALTELSVGQFETGFQNYEAGLRCGARPWRSNQYRHWQADQPTNGKSLLLLAEQGIGDEIMFASCIPDLLAKYHFERCAFACDPRLQPMIERSFPGLVVTTPSPMDAEPGHAPAPYDYELPIGSLPLHLRNAREAFEPRQSYLRCDAKQQDRMRRRLETLGEGLKVGISWRGGHDLKTRTSRSIELANWHTLATARTDMQLINVQYGNTAAEREDAANWGLNIHHWGEPNPLIDLDGFAALLAELDLLICIDNSTAHIGGAIGTRTWALLPAVADWRWQTAGDDTLWYESVRLFRRQSTESDWSAVFERVSDALRQV